MFISILSLLLFAQVSSCSNENEAQQLQSPVNYPIYMQSPIADGMREQVYDPQRVLSVLSAYENSPINSQKQQQQQSSDESITQRGRIPKLSKFRYRASARSSSNNVLPIGIQIPPQETSFADGSNQTGGNSSSNISVPQQTGSNQPTCLYDKPYFKRLGECLSHRSNPTIGLPAFKNEDLLTKSGLRQQKTGCSFILSNGLFKNQHLNKFNVDSDSQCLDNSRVDLSMSFSNATLYYLWTLRCLNRADQLQEDATLGGNTMSSTNAADRSSATDTSAGICVGSSQNFGFSSLQLANIDAQVELATDIYKNWRIVDISLAMAPTSQWGGSLSNSVPQSSGRSADSNAAFDGINLLNSHITDFTFESLDGDELNWRYLHLFKNWTLNRLHANFLEQYRRFLWISLQRCLSESSDKLPAKLFDLFGDKHYQ